MKQRKTSILTRTPIRFDEEDEEKKNEEKKETKRK